VTRQQWIAEAHRRIALAEETIQEMNETSGCDSCWPAVKNAGENATKTISFLREGIQLIEGSVS
jgi:hypothetical protein